MAVWKTYKPIVKNLIETSADEEWLATMTGTDAEIATALDNLANELWQEGYVDLDIPNLKSKDYAKIRLAAINVINELKDSEQ